MEIRNHGNRLNVEKENTSWTAEELALWQGPIIAELCPWGILNRLFETGRNKVQWDQVSGHSASGLLLPRVRALPVFRSELPSMYRLCCFLELDAEKWCGQLGTWISLCFENWRSCLVDTFAWLEVCTLLAARRPRGRCQRLVSLSYPLYKGSVQVVVPRMSTAGILFLPYLWLPAFLPSKCNLHSCHICMHPGAVW